MLCQRLLKALGFASLLCLVHAHWRATRSDTKIETICNGTFTPSMLNNTGNCNTDLQQVFKLLYVSDDRVLIGSTECLYILDRNLVYKNSIEIPAADLTQCDNSFGNDAIFQCKNYVTYAHPQGSSYRVCGTYNKVDPSCWICNETDCVNRRVVNYLPRYSASNFTVTMTNGFYYIGGLYRFTNKAHQIAKVEVDTDVHKYDPEVDTDRGSDTYIWDQTSFVGSIERGNFIYFFYREKAREYSNIGNIVYSRVARVCKDDTGGTGTLNGKFLTFLKTRLMCSVGNEYPFIFNEIQDVFQSPTVSSNFIYGLFTNPNAGLSSTAICRYNMTEIDELFNQDSRRGQPSDNKQWQSIAKDADDTLARRTCTETFPSSLNTYLQDNPLMNTNAPNCGLGTTTCNDYTRKSDEALAVFEGIRGQQLVITDDAGSNIKVYVGTNNNTVYEASITDSVVRITKQINIKADISMLTESQIRNSWPLAVTYLEVKDGTIYGTLDNLVFQITQDINEGVQILDRSPDVYRVHFPASISGVKIEIFKLFEGPDGSDIYANFSSGLETQDCSQKTFKSTGSGRREFLAVLCEISGVTDNLTEIITVSSKSLNLDVSFNVTVEIDNTELSDCEPSEVQEYDREMAVYRYQFNQWLINSVTCDAGVKDTCPSASSPGNWGM